MASINKTSVRDELDRLKKDFDRLSSEQKISSEITMLMRSMFTLLELIFAIFLEKKTIKTTRNSSKPPSQTDKDETALDQKGGNGKGKKELSQTAYNTREVSTVEIMSVTICDICGEDLTHIDSHQHERRTKIDIVFEKTIEHIDAEIKTCPVCAANVKGSFPGGFHGPLQYGNGLKAYAINMIIGQMVSLNRVQKCIASMIGQTLSEATLLKYIVRLHNALEGWEADAISQLLKSSAINVDETSLRVDKSNHWIHVYAAGDVTLKRLHRRRGIEAIDSIGIIPKYHGVIIHDCWASYLSYDHCDHGLCGSHLLRELAFIVDSNGYAWAKNIKRLLQETCKTVSLQNNKRLTDPAYKALQKRYRTIITLGDKELPEIPAKPNGQRGKMAKSDAHNLWERLKCYEQSVLLFARDSNVSFTNNRAERDLRMSKVKQKVSGCFRQVIYAHAYCRISSYLQTMANKGQNPLIAIQMVLEENMGGE